MFENWSTWLRFLQDEETTFPKSFTNINGIKLSFQESQSYGPINDLWVFYCISMCSAPKKTLFNSKQLINIAHLSTYKEIFTYCTRDSKASEGWMQRFEFFASPIWLVYLLNVVCNTFLNFYYEWIADICQNWNIISVGWKGCLWETRTLNPSSNIF